MSDTPRGLDSTEAGSNQDPIPPDPSRTPSSPDDDMSMTHLALFWAGLVAYGAGFGLLAAGWTQLAPVALVGGLMAMVAAFLI